MAYESEDEISYSAGSICVNICGYAGALLLPATIAYNSNLDFAIETLPISAIMGAVGGGLVGAVGGLMTNGIINESHESLEEVIDDF